MFRIVGTITCRFFTFEFAIPTRDFNLPRCVLEQLPAGLRQNSQVVPTNDSNQVIYLAFKNVYKLYFHTPCRLYHQEAIRTIFKISAVFIVYSISGLQARSIVVALRYRKPKHKKIPACFGSLCYFPLPSKCCENSSHCSLIQWREGSQHKSTTECSLCFSVLDEMTPIRLKY